MHRNENGSQRGDGEIGVEEFEVIILGIANRHTFLRIERQNLRTNAQARRFMILEEAIGEVVTLDRENVDLL